MIRERLVGPVRERPAGAVRRADHGPAVRGDQLVDDPDNLGAERRRILRDRAGFTDDPRVRELDSGGGPHQPPVVEPLRVVEPVTGERQYPAGHLLQRLMDARPSVRRQPAGAAVSDQRPSRELAERVTRRNAAAEVRESEDVPDRLRGEGAVAGARSGAELRVSEHERAVVEVARGMRPGLEPVVDRAGDGVSQRRPGPLGRSGDLGDLRARAGGGDRRRGGRQDEDEGAGESDASERGDHGWAEARSRKEATSSLRRHS